MARIGDCRFGFTVSNLIRQSLQANPVPHASLITGIIMAKSHASRLRRNEEILSVLRALHPHAFKQWGKCCSPLKIGIYQDILDIYPEMSRAKLQSALRAYTSTDRYLSALVLGIPRVDLTGKVVSSIAADESRIADKEGRQKFFNWKNKIQFEMARRSQTAASA